MNRYFIEVAYKGTAYSGFQVQENARTIQSEIEKAIATIQREKVTLTGSSRTDAGVHALQNFFHFDFADDLNPALAYKLNALLPADIAVRNIIAVHPEAHARYDAISRSYRYNIVRVKDPFRTETALFYPYALDISLLQQAAAIVKEQELFFSFCKTNTQVKNFRCRINESYWEADGDRLIYNIEGNRFLRGMVRLLTATILKVGRGKLTMDEFRELFAEGSDKCGFSIPATGLFLVAVRYPEKYFAC